MSITFSGIEMYLGLREELSFEICFQGNILLSVDDSFRKDRLDMRGRRKRSVDDSTMFYRIYFFYNSFINFLSLNNRCFCSTL
jgi:hypothetical protein